MRTRRMTGKIDAVRIAAEARGILVDPGDGSAALIRHRQQVAVQLPHIVEIDRDKMRAGIDEYLGRKAVIFRKLAAPGTAMNENVDRRIGLFRSIEIGAFD